MQVLDAELSQENVVDQLVDGKDGAEGSHHSGNEQQGHALRQQ